MKFSEAIEHLSAGGTLEYGKPGDGRTIRAESPPITKRLIATDGTGPFLTPSLEWLEGLILCNSAEYVRKAPRVLPVLPDGYEWRINDGASRPSGVRRGFAFYEGAALTEEECDAHRKQAEHYEGVAGAYRALVKEFKTR